MNRTNLKYYATRARLDFIAAVTGQANLLGISIDGREPTDKVSAPRTALIARIRRSGFEQVMKDVAYTWFKRFAALRFMEIHGYLEHGWRVLSSRDGGLPEILRHASEVSLPEWNTDRARAMQLAGNRDDELYKLLLLAQCNELSRSMPFLFERMDDETELLLPESLLRTDSIVARLVAAVPEEDWHQIEVIGWLYQFYGSDQKDAVIGKVVESEDIPAATQLFTPNWIVQYLVQNSVGSLWLMANPASTLASQWPYLIPPARQKPQVQARLDALIGARVSEDGEALNPETLTVLDPACGSGHILVVAYDVLKAIYLERGYPPRSIPRLILEKNLYGFDIDDRATQLAAFALLMKARADDPRLLAELPTLNVLSLMDSRGLDPHDLAAGLAACGVDPKPLETVLDTFKQARTFGSLIQTPALLNGQLPGLLAALQWALREGDLDAQQKASAVLPLVRQAQAFGMHFDAVVANPPYIGNKWLNASLREYLNHSYKAYSADLYGAFIRRAHTYCKVGGRVAMVTIQNWLFSSSFESMRAALLSESTIGSLLHIGINSFPDMNSKVAQAAAFSTIKAPLEDYLGNFIDLASDGSSLDKQAIFLAKDAARTFHVSTRILREIPGIPIAYWVSELFRALFAGGHELSSIAFSKQGLATGDNGKFIRAWFEVPIDRIGFELTDREAALASRRKWFPHLKGGDFRRWYGNFEHVVDWSNDGAEIRSFGLSQGQRLRSRPQGMDYYFKPCITWSDVTTSTFSSRAVPAGFIFSTVGPALFARPGESLAGLLGYTNSVVFQKVLDVSLQGLHYNNGVIGTRPYIPIADIPAVSAIETQLVELSRADWDASELSWDFKQLDWIPGSAADSTISLAWTLHAQRAGDAIRQMRLLEERNNQHFIEAYGLQNELRPEVLEERITLARADREKDCQRLVSYCVGCIMGRYSLDEPGLIYAHAGNIGFNPNRYTRFPADSDGVVPLTHKLWFDDDAASRVRDFMRAVWGTRTLEENMTWLAESLGMKGSETPDEAVRRYLADRFFKDHLHAYKKLPIYWLFCSGKQHAFQALVYLHRYNEGTLARLRAKYVVPLIAKISARLQMLEGDADTAESAGARTRIQKQIESLGKQQVELLAYDKKLCHYADMGIALDLDQGVKVNYARFGDLVAESKAITGSQCDADTT